MSFQFLALNAFAQAPTITTFSPSSGPVGSLVTITGTNFTSPTAFTIGGQSAIIVSNTGTSLVAMVMPGALTGVISVSNGSGTVNSAGNFTLIASQNPNTQQGSKIVGSGNISPSFQGASVSVNADGNTAAIGANWDNSNKGAVWIYTRNAGIWSQQSKLVISDNIGSAQLGVSVAISADGNTVIAGGSTDNSNLGAAWIFTRTGTSWSQQSKLIGSNNIGNGGQGISVSISADGNTALVGAQGDNASQGAAWVFTRSGTSWTEKTKLTATGNTGAARIGASVSISADGSTAILGGYSNDSSRGAAWVFYLNAGNWLQQAQLFGSGSDYAFQGSSVALSADGNTAVVGGPADFNDIGAAWIFTRSGVTWTQQGAKLIGNGAIGRASQGYKVSINADGNMVLVGGYIDNNIGATWLFTRSGVTWTQQDKLIGTGNTGNSGQSLGLSISSDGSTALIGGPSDNTNTGATWAFFAAPSITSATYDASTGVLNVTGVSLKGETGVLNDIISNKLTLLGEGSSTYILTSPNVEISSATSFSITLNATDQAEVNQILNKNGTSSTGGTTFNLAAAADWITAASGSADLTSNGITVSNVAVPAITSATYDTSTGALVIIGTGFLKSAGATNDIDATKITLTGQAGGTYTLTASTSNAEITSGTAFTLTLGTTDKTGVNALLNKNGLSSIDATTYNLAAAEDWNAGADAAVNIADLTGNGITVSIPPPTITSFSPESGAIGSSVTITGTKFNTTADQNIVFFGATKATVTAATTTSLTVTVPNGATYQYLSVTNLATGLTAYSKKPFSVTFSGGITFNPKQDYTTEFRPVSVIVSDLDGDGKPDMALPIELGSKVSVFRNTSTSGTVSFDPVVNYITGANPSSVNVGDIDGDGKPDLLVTNGGSNTISVFRNISTSGTLNFSAKVDFTTESASVSGPFSISIGDIDGDGKSDLAVANRSSSNIALLRNTSTSGNISFATYVNFTTVSGPRSLSIGDIDGDGKPDLASANEGANFISVLRNTSTPGTINFSTKVDFATATVSRSITIGDIDGDGKPDLAAVNSASGTGGNSISIFRNTSTSGTVNFDTKIDFTTGGSPFSLGIGDINGDGKPDLAAGNYASNTVSVLLNTSTSGTISFSPKSDFTTGSGPFSVRIGDIDGDGKSDLTVANQGGNSVSVIMQTTDITSATYNASTGALVVTGNGFASTAGALNDIVSSKLTLTGEGGSTYTLTSANVEISSGTSFSITLNSTDLAAINLILNKNGISSTGGTTFNLAAAADWMASSTGLADLTGNGITVSNVATPAISSATYDTSTGTLVITGTGFLKRDGATNDIDATKITLTGQAGGTYNLTASTANVEITSGTAFTLTLGTTDKTGVNALLNQNGTSSLGATTYNLAAAEDWNAGADAAVVIADLTGNGITVSNIPPVITSFTPMSGAIGSSITISGTNFNTTTTNNIVFFGATKATVTTATATSLTVTVPTGATYHYISVTNLNNGLTAYSAKPFIVTLSGGIAFKAKQDLTTGSNSSSFPFSVSIGDLDGDGKPDIVVANSNDNLISVSQNTSNSGIVSFAAIVNFTTGSQPSSVSIGDIDGDGKPDLAIANQVGNSVSVLRNTSSSGNITFAPKVDYTTGSYPSSVTIGDIDGNGKPDLAIANFNSNSISILRNTSIPGTLGFAGKVDFTAGTNPNSVSIGDIDGDGKPDLGLTNQSSNSLSVLRNTSNPGTISFSAKVDFSTGLNSNPHSASIGDLDGDGKPDLAVANLTSNSTSIFRNTSTVGNISFAGKVDFTTGSQPRAVSIGDIDGDEKPDLAVANIVSGSVSVFRNTSSSGTILFANKADFTAGTQPYSVIIGDINGDGKPDIAVSNSNSNSVSIFQQTIDISSATYNASTGALVVTGNGFASTAGALNDIVSSKLTLTGEGGTTYTLTSSNVEISSSTSFSITLNASDLAAVNLILNKNGTSSTGGTTFNLAAAADWLAAASGNADLTGNGITVSNVAIPAITSATYDTSTGALVITGTGFLKRDGATNDIDATKITLTGQAGGTYTLTSNTTNVEITSGTAFTLTLGTTDKTGVNALLNQNGTSSLGATTYNLAAAEDWNAGADAAVVIADLTGNGITVSNIPPVITSFTPTNAATGSTVTLTGTNFTGATAVSFGGTAATSFNVVSSTSITAVVAAGTSGNVSLTTPGGTGVLAGFVFIPPPTITSFTPESGAIGTSVTITGTNFNTTADQNIVFFGATKATVTAATATSLTVTVPSGATYQYISVTNLNTGYTAYSAKRFGVTFAGSFAFKAKQDLTGSPSGPQSINIGDIDGDGKPDLATTNNSSASVSIFRNTSTSGSVSFAARVNFTTGTNPFSISIGDIDGDGKPDLAVTNSNGLSVSVLRNTSTSGSISFDTKIDFTTGTGPASVSIGDINGDGKPDLATANSQSNTVSVFRNTSTSGSISFESKLDFNSGAFPRSVSIGDIDGDGKSDLVTANTNDNSVSVLRNTSTSGSVSFATKADFTTGTGTQPFSVGIGDIDGDGIPDLATANSNTTNGNSVSILRNTSTSGSISFATRVDYAAGIKPSFISIGDIDGDGKPDLAAANESSSTISVFRNTSSSGNVNFETKRDFGTGAFPRSLIIGDIDGDGKSDVATANFNGLSVSIFQQTAGITSATYDASTGVLAVLGNSLIATAGVLNDILSSKLTLTGEEASTYTLTSPNVEISSATSFNITLNGIDKAAVNQILNKNGTSSNGGTTFNLAAADDWLASTSGSSDLTGNGITVSNAAIPAISSSIYDTSTGVLVVTGTGFLKSAGATNDIDATKLTLTGQGGGTYTLTSNTANAEITSGTQFTLTLGSTDKTGVNTLLNKIGTSSVGGTTYILAASEDWNAGADLAVTIADLTGNGITVSIPPFITSFTPESGAIGSSVTITGTNFNTTANQNIVFFGATRATVSTSTATSITVTVPSGANYEYISVTNLEPGLTAYSAKPFIVTISGSFAFKPKQNLSTASIPHNIKIGDLDGDGKPDLVVANYGNASVSVFRNTTTNGTVSFADKIDLSAWGSANSINISDIDGDGKPDIVLASGGNFAATVLRNTSTPGSLSFEAKVDFGTAQQPNSLSIGDIDGDGKPDLAVVNFLFNNLSILRNTSIPGTISFATRVNFTSVGNPYFVSIGDINGDGKPDLAVANFTTSSVSLFRNISSPGTIALAAKVDLITGGQPRSIGIGDIDGDGKPDLSVANNGSNNVSVIRNTSTSGNFIFDPKVDFTTGTGPTSVSIGDINGDGKPDLAVANITSGSISLLENTSTSGNLSFAAKVDYNTGTDIQSVRVGDIDGDGKPDVVTSNNTEGSISIFQQIAQISAATYNPSTGILAVTGIGFGSANGATNDIVSSKLTLSGEGTSTYTLTSANVEISSATSFNITLNATDLAAVNMILNKNGTSSTGGTTFNLAAADDWMAASTGAADLTANAITVSGVATPIISSGTYDHSTGILSLTGTGLLKRDGLTNDIDVTKLTLTGQAGATYTLTANTNNVEISSPTAFSLTLGAIDKAAVNALLNKNGLSSSDGSTYNIAAADDWNLGADGILNISDLTGNGITVSNIPPVIASFTPTSAGSTTTVTLTGTNFTGANAVSFGGTTATSFNVVSATSITAVVAAGTSGNVSVTTSGGTGILAGFTFIPAPVITSFTPTSAATGATVTLTGTNFTGATALSFGGTAATSFNVVSATSITAVVAAGASGNVSVTTPGGTAILAGFTFIPAPVITSFTPTSAAPGATVTLTGTNFTGATALSFGGTAATSFNVVSATSMTAVVDAGTSGNVSVTAPGGTGVLAGFTFIPAPTITSFTPTSAGSTTTVTLTGTDFTGTTAISFGGTAATSFNVVSATSITAVVAAGTSGSVSVTTPGGTGVLAGFTFIPAPVITSFNPTSAASSSTVTLTGTNFTGATAVSFGGTAATSFNVVSATSITAVVAAGTSGNVSVTTPGGTGVLAGFTFIPAPVIASFTPTSTATGATVTLTGTNFTGATAVSFGGTAANSFNVVSSTSITAVVAAGTSGNVSVTTPGGTNVLAGFTLLSSDSGLSAMALSSGTLSPIFASATTNYTATVPFTTSSITLSPTRSEGTATIKVNGNTVSSGTASAGITLAVGTNVISTVVTAGDGITTKTYQVSVTRLAQPLSTEAGLSAMALSSGTLSPVFSSATINYTATVPFTTSSITLSPTQSEGTATIKVNGNTVSSGTSSAGITLAVGANVISTVVTAGDGTTTKTYQVSVTRQAQPLSTDAGLSAMNISSGTLSPVFASSTTNYTSTVPFSTSSITLSPNRSEGTATIKVNGNTVSSGTASTSIALAIGTNIISTVVTAGDGTTTKTYQVSVTRTAASTIANLLTLTLSNGTLSPAFAPATLNYVAYVNNNISSITLVPGSEHPGATIRVNEISVPSQSASGNIPLAVGSNTITIAATAENGTSSKTYTLTVTRVNSDQILVNENGNTTATNTAREIVVISPTLPLTITIPSGINNSSTVTYGNLISGGKGTIPQTSITTPFAKIEIPPSSNVNASGNSWNGNFLAPAITNYNLPAKPGIVIRTGLIVEIGSPDFSLSFDKALRIVLYGQAGMRVARVHSNRYEEILLTGADNQAAGDALAPDASFKLNSGNDLVIWTKGLSKFITFSETADLDVALVIGDKTELTDDLIKGTNKDLSSVTTAISLPSTGSNGSAITWESSDPAVLSTDGKTIARPLFGSGDVTVTLKATLTKGAITDTKTITVIVLQLPNQAPALNAIANQILCYTSSSQTIALSGITPGPESKQTTLLSISSSNSGLFADLSVSAGNNGTALVRYTPGNSAGGTATVTVTVKDNGGTANGGIDSFSRTFTVSVNPLPVINISSDLGTEISKGLTAQLTASGGSSYIWSNAQGIVSGQNSPILRVRPAITTTYTVTVTNASTGCSNTHSITIRVNDDYQALTINNVLTPNGDGRNDLLIIKNLDMYPTNTLKVFNKAGRAIYTKVNYTNDWDGTFNGSALVEDTYYYILDFGSGLHKLKGYVSIVR